MIHTLVSVGGAGLGQMSCSALVAAVTVAVPCHAPTIQLVVQM